MKAHQRKTIKVRAQTALFCAAVIWMIVGVLAELPAMAFQTESTPDILNQYEAVALYSGYAYASSSDGAEAIALNMNGQWDFLCQSDHPFKGIELVAQCNVPIGIARHLKVLKHKGMNHELYVADL